MKTLLRFQSLRSLISQPDPAAVSGGSWIGTDQGAGDTPEIRHQSWEEKQATACARALYKMPAINSHLTGNIQQQSRIITGNSLSWAAPTPSTLRLITSSMPSHGWYNTIRAGNEPLWKRPRRLRKVTDQPSLQRSRTCSKRLPLTGWTP